MTIRRHAPSRRDVVKTGAAAALASTVAPIGPARGEDDGPVREVPAGSSGKRAPRPFTTRPEIDGTFGVAATTHWIATAVAMAILEKGGNAFDAGVAAAFTLQVVEPNLSGPGGDASVMVYDKRIGTPEVICGQGPAPAAATIDHYRGHLGLQIVPGTGLLAACVPGTFETYMMILARHGTMRVRDVLEPAIGYARSGHPLTEKAVATISTVKKMFLEHWPTSAALYLPGGDVPVR